MHIKKPKLQLCLGTAQFGMKYGITNTQGVVSDDELRSILNGARDRGVVTLDTAALYGNAHSRLGSFGVDDFKIITKLPKVSCSDSEVSGWARSQINLYLKQLQINDIYGVLIHDVSVLRTSFGSFLIKELRQLQAEGLIKKIGISIYSPNEYYECKKIFNFQLVQSPLNLLDRRMLNGCLSDIYADGVEFYARSVFLQGLLLMNRKQQIALFGEWSDIWNEWHDWLDQHQLSPIQACIEFIKSVNLVDYAVVGVLSLRQLKEVIRYFDSNSSKKWPDIICVDEKLLNPSNWNKR